MLFCLVSPFTTVYFLVSFDSILPFLTEVTNWHDVMWLLHADMEYLNGAVVCVILHWKWEVILEGFQYQKATLFPRILNLASNAALKIISADLKRRKTNWLSNKDKVSSNKKYTEPIKSKSRRNFSFKTTQMTIFGWRLPYSKLVAILTTFDKS